MWRGPGAPSSAGWAALRHAYPVPPVRATLAAGPAAPICGASHGAGPLRRGRRPLVMSERPAASADRGTAPCSPSNSSCASARSSPTARRPCAARHGAPGRTGAPAATEGRAAREIARADVGASRPAGDLGHGAPRRPLPPRRRGLACRFWAVSASRLVSAVEGVLCWGGGTRRGRWSRSGGLCEAIGSIGVGEGTGHRGRDAIAGVKLDRARRPRELGRETLRPRRAPSGSIGRCRRAVSGLIRDERVLWRAARGGGARRAAARRGAGSGSGFGGRSAHPDAAPAGPLPGRARCDAGCRGGGATGAG